MTVHPSLQPSSDRQSLSERLHVEVTSYLVGLVITVVLLLIVNWASTLFSDFDVLQYLRAADSSSQQKALSLFVTLLAVFLSLALYAAVRCFLVGLGPRETPPPGELR